MQIKIITNDLGVKMEFVFETKHQNKQKFNPTSENKIHVKVEDDEDKYWYFL